MKRHKSILFAAVAAILTLTACSSDDYSYSIGEKSAGAYLTAAKNTFVFTPGQEQVIKLGLGRTEYAEAATVTLEGNNAAFNVPASVSFEPGEKDKEINIPFTLETGKTVDLTVKVTSATSAYGADSLVLTVKCDYEWISLGIGQYYDSFFFSEPYNVEVLQCTGVPNMYRFVGPYLAAIEAGDIDFNPAYPPTEDVDITIYNEGDTYAGQVIPFDGLVGYDVIHSGYYHPSYEAEIKIYHPSGGFKEHDTPDTWAYNKVLVYQDLSSNGVLLPGQVQMAPYYYMDGVGGWNYADDDGSIIITFPGYDPKDYTVDIAYTGRFTSTDGIDYARLHFNLGADVETAKFAVVPAGEDLGALAVGIEAGTVEAQEISSSGDAEVPLAESGKYAVVALAYAEETVVATKSMTFKYQASTVVEETWTAISVGTYAYTVKDYTSDQYGGLWSDTQEATLYVCNQNANRYKIAPWADLEGENGLIFEMSEDGIIEVDGAETGYIDEEYGMVYATDLVTYEIANLPSYYENGVYYFNLAYHDNEGPWTFVQDTFTPTAEASAAAKRVQGKSAVRTTLAKKHITKARQMHKVQVMGHTKQ